MQNWVSELGPSSGIHNNMFQKLDLFPKCVFFWNTVQKENPESPVIPSHSNCLLCILASRLWKIKYLVISGCRSTAKLFENGDMWVFCGKSNGLVMEIAFFDASHCYGKIWKSTYMAEEMSCWECVRKLEYILILWNRKVFLTFCHSWYCPSKLSYALHQYSLLNILVNHLITLSTVHIVVFCDVSINNLNDYVCTGF